MSKTSELKIEQIVSVYSGKNGRCCCGCSGKHSYAKAHQKAGSKRRGYEVTADEINDKQIARVFGIIKKADETGDVDEQTNHVSTVVGDRLYVAYILEQRAAKR